MSSDIASQLVKQILVDTFDWNTDVNHILPEHRLREDLELDSLAMVNLQVAIEDELGVRFDPIGTDLGHVFETVGTLVDFLRGHLGDKDLACSDV